MFILKLTKTFIPKEVGKDEKNLKKKIVAEINTQIGPCFQFPIPKLNFSLTLDPRLLLLGTNTKIQLVLDSQVTIAGIFLVVCLFDLK